MRRFTQNWVAGLMVGAWALMSAVSATAQSIVPPPTLSLMDGNGVNLADGKFNLPGLDVGIGGAGSGLARRTVGNSDNYAGTAITEFIPAAASGGQVGKVYLNIAFQGSVYRFMFLDKQASQDVYTTGPYIADGASGVTLTCSAPANIIGPCTLTLPDGTQAVYSQSLASLASSWGGLQYYVTAAGEKVTLTYKTDSSNNIKSVDSVSSSLGWALKYDIDGAYVVNKVTAINTSICELSNTSCIASAGFPTATLSTSGATTTLARNGTNLLSYSVSGNVTTLTSPSGVTKTITVNGSGTFTGRVSQVTTGGSTWTYAYSTDTSGNTTTTVTAPNNTTQKVTVTYKHQLISKVDEAGRTTAYYYDLKGLLSVVVNPDGNLSTGGLTAYAYDARGNTTATSVVPKGGQSDPTTWLKSYATYSSNCDANNYKYCNRPLTTTDANGVVTTYTYDDVSHGNSGQLVSVKSAAVGAAQAETRYKYEQKTPRLLVSGTLTNQDPVWRLTETSSCMTGSLNACVGGVDELKTVTTYKVNNLLSETTTTKRGDGSLAATSTIEYNDNGQIVANDGPKSGTIDKAYVFYDGLGRTIGTIGVDPDGSGSRNRPASVTHYDSDGRVDETKAGTVSGTDLTALNAMTVQARDTNEFNNAGLPIVAKHFIGTSTTAKDLTQRSYDNMLRIDCEAVRMNVTAPLNVSACVKDADASDGTKDRITKYNYDATTGALLSTISGYATTPRTDYTNVYDLSGATSTGNLLSVADAKGNVTSYTYDGFNRLIKTCYPLNGTASNGANNATNSNDCQTTTYRTTTLGGTSQASTLVASVTTRASSANNLTVSFGYDALGRVSSKGGAVSESFVYDNFGQVTSHTNNSVTETYAYNALGWLLTDTQSVGVVAYEYDTYGKRTKLTYPGSGLYTIYAYNDADELTGVLENGTMTIASFTYDDYGRRTGLGRGNGVSTTYGYDPSLRLGTVTQGTSGASFYNQTTYGYKASDQIASKSGTNSAYNYTVWAAGTTGYTANGLNQYATVASTSLGYDARGNLSNDGGGTYAYNVNNLLTSAVQSGITTTLTYDAENRLSSISKNGTTTKFLYDGTDLIAEYDGSGALLRRYVHGAGDDEPVVWYEGSGTGTKYYLGADDLGSVTVITKQDGTKLAINTYDANGIPGSGNTGRFQYTGQTWLPEIGMYYYKARLYNPILGRFMQTDPIGYGDGINWYDYVHGDWVNGSDPGGTSDVIIRNPGNCRQNCIDYFKQATDRAQAVSDFMSALRDNFDKWNTPSDPGQCAANVSTGAMWGGVVGAGAAGTAVVAGAGAAAPVSGGASVAAGALGMPEALAAGTATGAAAGGLLGSATPSCHNGGTTSAMSNNGGSGGGSNKLTNAQVRKLAEKNGWTEVEGYSKKQVVFKDAKGNYWTQDIDKHLAGAMWKKSSFNGGFGKPSTRLGTFDANLNRIGK